MRKPIYQSIDDAREGNPIAKSKRRAKVRVIGKKVEPAAPEVWEHARTELSTFAEEIAASYAL